MPFQNNTDLPARVREGMPEHAQSIFRNTFNNVMEQNGVSEASAFAQAYGAVENAGYRQDTSGNWNKVEKHLPGKHDQKTHGRGGKGKGLNLTQDEIADIEFYTGTGYAGWNKALRSDPNSAAYKQAVQDSVALDSALKKLPASPGTSYRNMKVDSNSPEFDNFIKSHREGGIVTYRAYTSTSGISDIASFGGKGDTMIRMKINGKSGRDISKYSKGMDEQEILFGRDSKFVIKKVKKVKDGYEIEMDESA